MQQWKILLADDDSDDKAIINEAMELLGAQEIILFTENGEEILRSLDDHFSPSNMPCLIVLDLNMPRMNGTETLRHLKQDSRYRDIPVIIYSTSINPLEKEKCMMLGAHSYITKPVSFKESMETAKVFLQFCNMEIAK